MPYDYSELRGRIKTKFDTQARFSVAMGFSARTCSLKLKGKVPWKQSEIIKSCKLLDIAETDISKYFFALKVQSD